MTFQASSKRLLALAAVTTGLCGAWGQEAAEKVNGPRGCPAIAFSALPMKTFSLRNAAQASDANEMLTGLRLILDPATKLYLVPSENVIVARGCPEELATAQKVLDDIDRPRKRFRLLFTLTEFDGAKKVGVQHVSLFVEDGQRSTLKSGSKIPIVTGSYSQANASQQQMTYLDVGTNFDATAIAVGTDEVLLKAKVEQSLLAEDKSGVGPQDPIIRQTVLESASLLTAGKAQVLGSVDVTGTTRHMEVEVTVEGAK